LAVQAELLKEITVQVRDLSADGCLLEVRVFLPVGTVGLLEVTLEGRPRTEWFRTCRVQATHGKSGAYLVGAEFLCLTPAGAESVRHAVRTMRPMVAHGISAMPGRLSGNAGNTTARRTDRHLAAGARVRNLLPSAGAYGDLGRSAEVGSAVAPSTDAAAPTPGAPEDGEVS
jgi:hypothetical protein